MSDLDIVRARIGEMQRELAALQTRSRGEVQAQVLAQIREWRQQADASALTDLQRMAAGQPVQMLEARAVNGLLAFGPLLIAAVGEEAVAAWLDRLTAHLTEGLEPAARAGRIAVLQRDLAEAERSEEALLREAESEGILIDPRPDADPAAALLQVTHDA